MWGFGVLFLTIYLVANGYLFWRVMGLVATTPLMVRIVVGILFWLCALMLFVSMALRHSDLPQHISRTMFSLGSGWLIFLLYATLLTALFDIVRLTHPALPALLITAIVMVAGYVNYRNPKVVHYNLPSPKVEQQTRLVAISDVHLGHGTDRADFERYIALINAQKPDMVLIAGDLIDNSLHPVRKERIEEAITLIEAPRGIFMAVGNHEYISGIDEAVEYLATTPIRVLRDSSVVVGDIAIVGRDDKMNRERQPLAMLMPEGEHYTIVLDHQPTAIMESAEAGIDLHISGHTHRGQVWPLNLITDHIFEQSHGYRKWCDTHAIVSMGLSLWGPKFRIGTSSELIVIDIEPTAESTN